MASRWRAISAFTRVCDALWRRGQRETLCRLRVAARRNERKRMDGFVFVIVLAFAALSLLPVDWQKQQQTAWVQVILMAAGIVLIGLYLIVR